MILAEETYTIHGGAVITGLVIIVLVLAALWFWRHRNR